MVYPRKSETPSSMVGRFLLILDAFAVSRSSLTLSEISQLTRLPITTTYRLLAQLTESDALVRDDNRRYWIGPRLERVCQF